MLLYFNYFFLRQKKKPPLVGGGFDMVYFNIIRNDFHLSFEK